MGLKYLDLYQLHWPSKSIPISETMNAMEKLVEEGKIRHIGVTNFSLEELKEAQSAMRKYEIVSNQVEYNIVTRDIEKTGLFDYCDSCSGSCGSGIICQFLFKCGQIRYQIR